MSWFTNLANSLGVDDDDDDDTNNNNEQTRNHQQQKSPTKQESLEDKESSRGGVKEDLSELTKTLTRQLWGVASFLAPPPPPPPPPRSRSISDWNNWDSSDQSQSVSREASEQDVTDAGRIAGIRNDFAEIGGRFRNEISKLSSHKAVSEISKIASIFVPFGSEVEEGDEVAVEELIGGSGSGDVVGVTKEVLTFARNISMHPETWLDFPLADDEDSDDFDMSDAQQEHALAVERLAPRLAALRIELCPGYMSEGCFWKIYFVLLHPRLNKHDADLLSTPQIVEARAMLTQDLQNRTKTQELSARGTSFSKDSLQEEHYPSSSTAPYENTPLKTFACDTSNFMSTEDVETEKYPVVSTEIQIIDKSVVEEEPVTYKNKDVLVSSSSKYLDQKDEEDGDEWLEDESSDVMGSFTGTNVPLGNEEDVSFSDLEDDDDDDDRSIPTSSKAVADSSSKPQDWVQLNRTSTDSKGDLSVGTGRLGSKQSHANDPDNKDANDWLNVDDTDVI